jgi:RNA polymerase sigma-70 factor (ECF subfamily)
VTSALVPATGVAGEIVALLPRLRMYARKLGRGCDADTADLVQDTVWKALANIQTFEPGTNLMGWLHTIMHNQFVQCLRKTRLEFQDEDDARALAVACRPSQLDRIEFEEVAGAFDHLVPEYRSALLLVAALGHSYEDAARIEHSAIGTMKSRVNRARARLVADMDGERPVV